MATIHFMHGFIGSGKTTFAKKLEKELPAIRFNNDELMVMLYGRDVPEKYFRANYRKIDALIWKLTSRMIELGNDVIIDLGFWSKGARDSARKKTRDMGVQAKFYYVYCPADIALKRTLKRTENSDEMFIDENCFNLRLKQFEPMGEGEEFILIDNSKDF